MIILKTKKKRIVINTSDIISICALFVSISTFFVFSQQTKAIMDHNIKSLHPHIQISPILTGTDESGLYIENAGTGTAFVKSISFKTPDGSFNASRDGTVDFFSSLRIDYDCFKQQIPQVNSAIRADKKFALLKTSGAKSNRCFIETIKLLTEPTTEIEIDYYSAYGTPHTISHPIGLTKKNLGPTWDLLQILKSFEAPEISTLKELREKLERRYSR